MQEEEQTTEVRTTDEQVGGTNVQRETVRRSTPMSGVVIMQRVVWFIAGVFIVMLALRVLLLLLAANQGNFFVDFVYAVGGFLAAPFSGIFGSPTYGKFFFDTASVVGIVVYALVAWGLTKLVTLTRPREEV
ncbi:MAG TPA: hypothetical protein VGE34_03520 [Candidatus Saccharimonadales bacterium]